MLQFYRKKERLKKINESRRVNMEKVFDFTFSFKKDCMSGTSSDILIIIHIRINSALKRIQQLK